MLWNLPNELVDCAIDQAKSIDPALYLKQSFYNLSKSSGNHAFQRKKSEFLKEGENVLFL